MNSQQLDQQIRERISTFLEQLSSLVRQSALEAVREALSGSAPTPARRGPGRPAKASTAAAPAAAAPAARKTGKRGKRSSEDVTELAAHTYDYISKNPNQSIEEIGRGMNKATKVLKLPIKKLIEAKKLKTTGQRRGTRYFAK